MPIELREDVAYILLKKISEGQSQERGKHEINLTSADLAGRNLSESDLLGHLDYLNQRHYINADFSGNAYGNQEDAPDLVNPKEVDIRIANTYGSSDGPLPHLIQFERAELTEKGRKLLEKMDANPPASLREGPSVPIVEESMPFLEKVMLKGNLEDIFDARDVSEVVFRTMRDVMPTETVERVASELHEEALPTDDKALQNEVAELWNDTNPIVRFLSRIRPPLEIKPQTFLFRIEQEGGLPRGVTPETAINAVFSATKDELSEDRIHEISGYLPDGIRDLWEAA